MDFRFFALKTTVLGLFALGGVAPALAQAELGHASPAALSTGWLTGGQSVQIKTRLLMGTNIQNVKIGYSIFNQKTNAWVATQTTTYASVSAGQSYDLDQTFVVPAGTPAGVYRVAVQVQNGWPGANNAEIWQDRQAGCFTVTAAATPQFGIPVRGCSELPTGALRAAASQIVDANGNPVKLNAVNWAGTSGPARSASDGLPYAGFKEILKSFRQAGFNTVRIGWSDVNLYARPTHYWQPQGQGWSYIDPATSPELLDPAFPQPDATGNYTFLKTIDIYKKYVEYGKAIGLRFIFSHMTNEGASGQQPNGLWFDKDTATGLNSDGASANNGTITYAAFKANSVALAQAFAAEPAVVGFELHNEPSWKPTPAEYCTPQNLPAWQHCQPVALNWGVTNNSYDIKYMAQDVGNAILGVNGQALVIVEAPFVWNYVSTIGMKSMKAINGNLTAVAGFDSTPANPVVLSAPNRLAYSIHEYPLEVSDPQNKLAPPADEIDSGAGYMLRMSDSWGHVMGQNIAPVLITEYGGYFKDPPTPPSTSATNWSYAINPYLNLRSAQFRGPRRFANHQGVSTAWWRAGNTDNGVVCSNTIAMPCDPNGNQTVVPVTSPTGWGNDPASFIQAVRSLTDAMRYTGPGAPSQHNTVIGTGASLIDAAGNSWSLQGGQVKVNGVVDTSASGITRLAYVGNRIYRVNTAGSWAYKTAVTGSWTAAGTVSPLAASPNGAIAMNGSAPLIDSAGNFWYIGGGKVVVNGTVDASTSDAGMLAYLNNVIWVRRNSDGRWWSRTSPSAGWLPSAGTLTPPALVVSPDNRSIVGDDGWIVDANKNAWMLVNNQLMVNGAALGESWNVVELVYRGGKIWKKMSTWQWQSKVLPYEAWSAATPTAPTRITSPTNVYYYPGGNGVVDAGNISWVIAEGQIFIDGMRDTATANVVRIAYFGGKVWQQNAAGGWYSKANLWDAWTSNGTTAPF